MSSLKKWSILIFLLLSLSIGLLAIFLQIRSRQGDGMTCIFCDIVNKKADTELLYEDEVADFIKEFNQQIKFFSTKIFLLEFCSLP